MDRLKLLEALTNVNKALKGTGNLNIKIKDKKMEVSGSSQHLSIWCRLDTDAGDMEVAVKAATAIAAVTKIPGDNVTLSLAKTGLCIAGNNSRVILPLLEYKENSRSEKYESKVKTTGLAPYVAQVIHALDDTGYNPMMSAIHLQVYDDGGFQLTALDGKRYSIRNTKSKESSLVSDFVIYGKELNEALRLLGSDEVIIYRPESGNFIRLVGEDKTGDNLEIQIAMLDGKYFNLDSLRSEVFPIRLVANRETMLNAVTLVQLVSKKTLVDISPTEICFTGHETDGETESRIPIRSKGLDQDNNCIQTAFMCTQLIDALKSIEAENVTIHMKSSMNQFCITEGHHAIEMVLPIRREK